MALTYRGQLNRPLTSAEIDANFAYFTGSHSITGSIEISGSIIPTVGAGQTTSSFSLGSETAAWKDIYVSEGSIKFVKSGSESITISAVQGGISINGGGVIGSGSSNTTGSINTSGSVNTTGSINTSGNVNTSGSVNTTGSINTSGSTNTTGSVNTSGSVNTTGNVNTTGSINTSGSINTTGNVNTSGSTNTTGSVNTSGSVNTTGSVNTSGSINTTGSINTSGSINTTGSINTSGSINTTGSVSTSGSTTTTGTSTVTGSLNTTGSLNVIGNATVTGSTTISGSLIVTGSTISTLGFTGSLLGTVTTASYLNTGTGQIFDPLAGLTTFQAARMALTASNIITLGALNGVNFDSSATFSSFIRIQDVNTSGGRFVVDPIGAPPTHTGTNGQILPFQSGSVYRIYVYLGGQWRSASLF